MLRTSVSPSNSAPAALAESAASATVIVLGTDGISAALAERRRRLVARAAKRAARSWVGEVRHVIVIVVVSGARGCIGGDCVGARGRRWSGVPSVKVRVSVVVVRGARGRDCVVSDPVAVAECLRRSPCRCRCRRGCARQGTAWAGGPRADDSPSLPCSSLRARMAPPRRGTLLISPIVVGACTARGGRGKVPPLRSPCRRRRRHRGRVRQGTTWVAPSLSLPSLSWRVREAGGGGGVPPVAALVVVIEGAWRRRSDVCPSCCCQECAWLGAASVECLDVGRRCVERHLGGAYSRQACQSHK